MANDLDALKAQQARHTMADVNRAAGRAHAETMAREELLTARKIAEEARPSPVQLREQAVADRRIAEEKAHYERGFPVAGHDFKRERWERQHGGRSR